MIRDIAKIIKYQMHDNLRSKWIIGLFLFYSAASYWLISFSGDSSKVLLSLLNITIILNPLICIVFGTVYFYNNKNYIIFMLTQPVNRSVLFSGLYFGLIIPLTLSFLIGIGLPVIINLNLFLDTLHILSALLYTGVIQIFIFTGFSFFIAAINEDKLKGLGISIFIWLFFGILYDGLILFLLQILQDYPIEKIALGLILANPVDLGRILVIIEFDISALMGYTGAVFEDFFGKSLGTFISFLSLTIWFFIPFALSLVKFSKKDL
ncbi:MAG: ABC transporter permease subunit [Melioribacteraceae bacterium]|nr:ABC transporter permease subunit [Melioribacteraceae bacterium]MDD3558582.1 ABC transporter permease subunit [Melioribacteraceae bacterium]